MEKLLAFAPAMWDKFTTGGTYLIQDVIFALSGYEMSELVALVILLGSSASLIIWLLLKLKGPKKVTYLMEGGHRYYRP